MSKFYLTFNDDSSIGARLISGVNEIPDGALSVSDEVWLQTSQEIDGIWTLVGGEVVKLPHAETAPDYPALIASTRYQHETAGITVQGVVIDTGRDSQALITGAALAAVIDPAYTCNWKTAAGFVVFDATQLVAIASAIRAHVQACFDREGALLAAVADSTYTDSMLIEGWPT